ncbi:hypothetical protein AMTRI_Chr02g213990 [Amborella trichopoda]|nr:uncharacterized protein LOC18443298 [Amborella trichopoda]|eukprot:XP_006853552.2 uncharacterized protein LOC18443298 [Amborella trichopoda]
MGFASSSSKNVPIAEAVLLGALAPGVNRPTWLVLNFTFLALGFCLAAMLFAAFFSQNSLLILHILVLIFLSGMLFALLNWFLAQTGLVSIEQQMEEMGLAKNKEPEQRKDE